MAEQHTLLLKAVLDTTLVKQELEKLRQMQKQALGSGAGEANANGRGINNVNGITSTLNRLNVTLQQLQRSLAQGFGIMHNQMNAGNTSKAGGSPLAPIGLNNGSNANTVMLKILGRNLTSEAFFKKNKVSWLKPWALPTYSMPAEYQEAAISIMSHNSPAAILARQAYGFPATGDINVFRGWLNNTKYVTGLHNYYYPKKQQNPLSRGMIGMFAHQGAGIAQDAMEMLGYEKQAQWVGGIGKMGSYATMGSAAGPWGALAGGAIGAIETMFDVIKKRADEIAAEVDEWNAGVQKANDFRKMRKEFRAENSKNDFISKAAKEENVLKLLLERAAIQRKADERNEWLNNQENYAKFGSVAGNVNEILAKYEKDLADLKQIDNIIEQINKKKEHQAELDKKAILTYRKQALMQINDWKYTTEARSNLKFINFSSENTDMLGENYFTEKMKHNEGVYRKRARESYEQWQKLLNDVKNAKTPEDALKMLETANQKKTDFTFAEGQADIFNGAIVSRLQDKLANLRAPDMSNATSIANMGFGMGERSDDSARLDSQIKFLKEQSDLQKQIKDLIAGGVEAQITL